MNYNLAWHNSSLITALKYKKVNMIRVEERESKIMPNSKMHYVSEK